MRAAMIYVGAVACALAGCGDTRAASDAAIDDAPDPMADATADAQIDPPIEPLADPQHIAGPLTVSTWGQQPFLTPASIDEVLQTGFSLGRELFVAAWVVAPNTQRPNIDGLGPLLHATSCAACHPASGRPASLEGSGGVGVGILFRLARADGPNGTLQPDPVFGGQLQPLAITGVPAEATITYRYVEPAPDGIAASSARPVFAFATNAAYGPLGATTHASPRLSPQLAGMGLLEAVTEETVREREDPLDDDGDGISGRAAILADGALGRFGWKAVQSSLRGQTAGAFAGDIGIASVDRADDCTDAQLACRAQPAGGSPEIAAADVEAVDTFSRYLGVPAARRDNADPIIARGHALFFTSACAGCHRPTLVTGPALATPVLAHVTFHPYTDLLLHDLGAALADEIGEGDARPAEWRTPPLWGVGLVESAGGRFLHDGRAASLDDAIRWHGGEATRARDTFVALPAADRDALLAYVRSL